jgi:energy-coupling factor transporter transmembrane protein EcfT
MSALPIAAQLNSALYAPLVILLVAYAVLAILAGRARGHEDRASADRYAGYGFGLVLLSAVWTVVLVLSAVVSYPSRFYDMLIIIVVIIVFFALLVGASFTITELIPRALRRGDNR